MPIPINRCRRRAARYLAIWVGGWATLSRRLGLLGFILREVFSREFRKRCSNQLHYGTGRFDVDLFRLRGERGFLNQQLGRSMFGDLAGTVQVSR